MMENKFNGVRHKFHPIAKKLAKGPPAEAEERALVSPMSVLNKD
jgi:hypothetical protein